MNEAGYDDGLVHGHRWASEPFGYCPRKPALRRRHEAMPPLATARKATTLIAQDEAGLDLLARRRARIVLVD
ncbi:conserved protein of unknown function [Rhodovastum atsumiense]|uniref:Uncharacterized protein n=1 Tax=Rhodovastum atsumiense TaxID=504468 RepID=A0A5M6J1H4_9PROT|nr:hypothetical protein [Rhodovastum atsumiense]KAA5613498.1 hypothetical protein F1189_05430 [Rhodovastum atsumiense]CAH2603245.1 conserved protein of unknown function [Rhodovastum atsumiense]